MRKFTCNNLSDGFRIQGSSALGLIEQIVELNADNSTIKRTLEERLQEIESQVGIGDGTIPADIADRITTIEEEIEEIRQQIPVNPDSGGSVTPSPDPAGSDDENSKLTTVYAVRGTVVNQANESAQSISNADYQNNISNTITIRWNSDSDASYYKVWSKKYNSNGVDYTYELLSSNIKSLSYDDNSIKQFNTRYQYAVSSVSKTGVESSKIDSNRITTSTGSIVFIPTTKFDDGNISIVYNQTYSRVDVECATLGNMMHYYIIRDGKLLGRASVQDDRVIFNDEAVVSGAKYTYKIVAITNAGLWTVSGDRSIVVPGTDIELTITIPGEAKIGNQYYLFNNRSYQYTMEVRAISSDQSKLEQINKFTIDRYQIDNKQISNVSIYNESETVKKGQYTYTSTYPGDFLNVTVTAKDANNNSILATTKRYIPVDPILYYWYPDPNNDIVHDDGVYQNGEIPTTNITVDQNVLKEMFNVATVVNGVRDREIEGKIFGTVCNDLYRNLPDIRLFIFVPKSNEIPDRYFSFRLISPDDGQEVYSTVPFFGIKGDDIIYDHIIPTSYGNISSEYRVYISAIKYDDKIAKITDGQFRVVGHTSETK